MELNKAGEGIEDDKQVEVEIAEDGRLQYTLTQVPPVPLMISAALQHILMNLAYSLTTAFIVSDVLCAAYDSPIRTRLFSSTLLMSGVCTLLQTGFGIRLPIYQGPSASFFPALLALKNSAGWQCPQGNVTNVEQTEWINRISSNETTPSFVTLLTQEERLQQLSGSLMAASFFEILTGATGLVGFMLRYLGPITIGPTIALIGLGLFKIPIHQSKPSWEISFAGIAMVMVFALYIPHVKIPLPACGKRKERNYVPVFQLLPVLLSMLVMWGICGVLTITNVFPNDPSSPRYNARTDAKLSLLERTPWFLFPYPGQFGMPSFNLAAFVGFLTGFSASMVESIGDYFAAAKACQVAPPPDHAVSRGILMEGLGALLGGGIGTGHATTSYSGNISALTITKTASRSIMLLCGAMNIGFAVLGKFGAGIALIPDPTLAGVLVVLSGLLVALGLNALRHVNMNSARNLTIVGVALFLGVFVPEGVERDPDFINTGMPELDAVLKVALGTPMFVGGIFAMVLDNTVRGSREDRGLVSWRLIHQAPSAAPKGGNSPGTDAYEWQILPKIYQRFECISRLPFMPPAHKEECSNHLAESSDLVRENLTRV